MHYTKDTDVFISKMIKLYPPKYKMAKKGSYRNNKSIKMSIFQNLVYRCIIRCISYKNSFGTNFKNFGKYIKTT